MRDPKSQTHPPSVHERARRLSTSSITSAQAHSHKQTVKLTYSLSYLLPVNKRREAVKAGKLSKPQTAARVMNWAASQRNFSSSLGLKRATQPLIGSAARNARSPPPLLPLRGLTDSGMAGSRLRSPRKRYATVWPLLGLRRVTAQPLIYQFPL